MQLEKDAQEREKLDGEKIEQLKKIAGNLYDVIIAKLEAIPDLDKKIEALQQSTSFQDIGDALSPIQIARRKGETQPLCTQVKAITKSEKREKQKTITNSVNRIINLLPSGNSQKIGLLDGFGGFLVFAIWVAMSGWVLSSFGLSWGSVVALAVFWLFFIVAFRVIIGGILS